MAKNKKPIIMNGVVYATPERFTLLPNLELWGLFLANAYSQYDEWLFWDIANEENLDAIRSAGVPIYDENGNIIHQN
jgi:hypothetical protein